MFYLSKLNNKYLLSYLKTSVKPFFPMAQSQYSQSQNENIMQDANVNN